MLSYDGSTERMDGGETQSLMIQEAGNTSIAEETTVWGQHGPGSASAVLLSTL